MSATRPFIVIDSRDNVATATLDLKRDQKMATASGEVILRQDIPFGHKFALADISQGAYVVKYGAAVGRAFSAIGRGEHVHVHNVEDIVDEVYKQ